MNIYLVQHAEAKSEEEDLYRHLTEKGITDIKKITAYLNKHALISVNEIIHSGKRRAHQTAEILAKSLNPVNGIRQAEALDPLADPLIWAKKIEEMEEDIMLVGHLPHLKKLSSYLITKDEMKEIINFQNGGVVCLNKDEEGNWSISWMLVPSIID